MNPISFPNLQQDASAGPVFVGLQNTASAKANANEKYADYNEYGDYEPVQPERNLTRKVARDKYGYEEATPDSTNTTTTAAHPPSKYGYEDAEPTAAATSRPAPAARGVTRRSSLKLTSTGNHHQNQHNPQRGVSRSASMGCGATTLVQVRVRGQRFPVERRRSIDFAKTVMIREIEPILELAESYSDLWLKQEEFAQMKCDRRAVVQKHKQGKADPKNKPEETLRGLERYLDKSIRMQKNMAWDTVLLEQDEQEMAGQYDPNRIADLYKHTTYTSPEKAVERAQQDQEDVREYLMSPRTTKLMMRRLSC